MSRKLTCSVTCPIYMASRMNVNHTIVETDAMTAAKNVVFSAFI